MTLPPLRAVLFVAFLLPLATAALPAATAPHRRLGFLPASAESQDRGETAFLATPTPQQAEKWLRELTEEPHVAGTENDHTLAVMVRDRLKDFGFDTEIVTYPVLLNYPKHVALRMVEPSAQELSLFEEGYLRDKDSFSHDAFPAFHGYGASGRASGQVIYANYGTDEDFKALEGMGVQVKGRIVLVRYGGSFRGLKVQEAQARGASAVIIYSDPADDGYMKGDIYPDGPMRPPSSIQRGSVQFLSLGPGDPQTPGYASTPSAKRIPREKLEGIPKIPSLPLSYGEAEKILRALAGQPVPEGWQGGLPFAYHVGPGPAKVEMEVEMDYAVRPIWDVFGRLAGSAEPDRWVILGNHRDAWTYGAVDPNSGTASLLETARGLGAAAKAGWRPRRTLVLASWDAEEYGLLGSTEWGEDRASDLTQKAVAYVNLDSSVTGGDLDVDGVPSLRDLVVEVADEIPDPARGKSVGDLWKAKLRKSWNGQEPICPDGPEKLFEPALGPLGSGSDYTVFTDHLGIASLSFGFSGRYGVYHSTLDDFFWMKHFGDPDFLYHVVAARFYGLLAMRLTGSDVVPMRYLPYASALEKYLDAIRRQAIRERRNAAGAEAEPGRPPEKPALEPDFKPLLSVLARFRRSAAALDAALDALPTAPAPGALPLSRINDAVVGVEREFLDPSGIPGRPWFRHTVFAPGLTTGYAAWPFPGLTQSVKERDASMWEKESRRLRDRLQAAAAALDRASSIAGGASSPPRP